MMIAIITLYIYPSMEKEVIDFTFKSGSASASTSASSSPQSRDESKCMHIHLLKEDGPQIAHPVNPLL